jgi:hypothetical protein
VSEMGFHATGPQPPWQLFAGMRVVDDPEVGAWIDAGVDRGRTVRSLVPGSFEAYAVLFHPAFRETAADEQPSLFAPDEARFVDGMCQPVYYREVRWAEVAAANGRVAHPTMEWAAITGDWSYRWGGEQPGLWDNGPQMGSLPLAPTIRLCELLKEHTTTPARCFFGRSAIYGDVPDFLMQAPAALDTRVVSGPLLAVPGNSFSSLFYESPNLWWPADRAWFVHSNCDFQETYIGATDACIDALVADPGLEAMRLDPNQMLTDTVNPEPAGEYRG